MGNSSETFLLTAFLFGLKNSILLLVLGMLEDSALLCRSAKQHAPHWPMMVVTAYAIALGSLSLIRAWNWSANQGPVQRLTTRAFGVAVGYLIPAIVAAHAIYFHWLPGLESFFGREFVTLLGSHFRA